MTKKLKAINHIKKEINKCIKLGHSLDLIKIIMAKEVDPVDMDHDLLNRIIEDVVAEHPSYELIQKIGRSKLVVDKNSKEEIYYVLDPLHTRVDSIHRTRLFSLFFKPDFTAKTYVANFEYSPNVRESLFKNEEGLWNYNLYIPPEWLEENYRSNGVKTVPKCKLPEMYKTFLMHLVGDSKESYEYILDWLSTAILSRNYTILTTIGNQGIGKGVLGEIMRELLGAKNFYKTECRLLTKDFNKQILNKKLVYIDELKIKNASEENKIKTLVNDYIEIEGKGLDAVEVENFASIYVSSNELDAIKLRGDDRRFSVVELTKVKLLEVMKDREVSELLVAENIAKLAFFLYHRTVERKMSKVFITKRTEEVRESSLKDWEEFFLDNICMLNDEILMKDASEEIENVFGSRCRPSKAAFTRLMDVYPDKFKIVRRTKDGKRVWFLEFGNEK